MVSEQFIEEMSELTGVAPDFRANVPAGAIIGQESLQPGHQTTWKKSKSGMRMGSVDLPDRVAMYDLQRHDISMVPPTILFKRMSEHPGRFTSKRPATWVDPKPIDDTCVICAANRLKEGITTPKPFYDPFDLVQHYTYMHSNEWAAILRNKEEAVRREDANRMERLIATVVAAIRPDVLKDLDQEARDAIGRLQAVAAEASVVEALVAEPTAPAKRAPAKRGRPKGKRK